MANGDSVTADFYYATRTVEMQADVHGRRSRNVTVLHLHYCAICRPRVALRRVGVGGRGKNNKYIFISATRDIFTRRPVDLGAYAGSRPDTSSLQM